MRISNVSIVLASAFVLATSRPVCAAEKVAGVNKDFQRLSETAVNIPDKPGHTFKQITLVWKSASANPNFDGTWTNAVAQQDNFGNDITERAYATNHHQNGDLSYFSFEGTAKITRKDGGDFENVAQGRIKWLGGTGMFKNIKGMGIYTCKFTPKGGQCDWEAETEM